MSNSPLVSIVIPAYNAVRFLSDTLGSVFSQSFQDFEILVVNDGSTDETEEMLLGYGDKIRYLPKLNGGVSSARNYGIEMAEGKYVAFLDADDVWMPEKLEKQIALMEANSEIGLCYAATQKVDEELNYLSSIPANAFSDYTEALLLNLNIVAGSCSSAVVRRDVLSRTTGFDSQFTTYADWELWLRLSLLTKFAPLPEELVKYRVVAGSMSSKPHVTKKDALGVLEKFFTLPNLPEKYKTLRERTFSNHLMIVAGEFLHNRNFSESLGCMLQAIKLYPRNIIRPLGLPVRVFKRLLKK
jgi:glycosyltransferase involved in cell wall biosynthesis